ncbi:MAG: Crp/Fnr family transcriptional regulator [Bacteroidota bacterium]
MTEKLIKSINKLIPNTTSEAVEIFEKSKIKTLKKGEHILREGQLCSSYYFVNNGVLRTYFLDDGIEISNWFAFENFFFTELESYTFKKPSKYYIQAIEACEVLVISRKQIDDFLKHPIGQEYVRKNWEYAFIHLNNVITSFQSKSAKERYEELLEFPDFIQRIKQKDLSSMLGISQYSLSRIRNKKNQ